MLIIPRLKNNGTVDLVIVLEDSNIERIKQYDPAELIWRQLPETFRFRVPNCIGVTYATAEEVKALTTLVQLGDVQQAFDLVTRGFKYRPEAGDHDLGPQSLITK